MQPAANVTSGDVLDWHAIDWKHVYRTVKNLRQRIFRASREGDLRRVRSLQRLMLRCTANVLESVRRVTQVNQGQKTAGVDQVVTTTPEERGALCRKLHQLELHKVHPVRRVYIPKKKGKRPLGIPTIEDRCVQAMVKTRSNRSGKPALRASAMGFALGEDATMRLKKSFVSHG